MGKRGPQPKPAAILDMRDSWRAKERAETELKIVCETPDVPLWLNEAAKAEWNRVAPAISAIKILTRQDRAMLAMHCHAWGEFEWACEMIQKILLGECPEHDGKLVDHPRVVLGKARETLIKTTDRFGLSAAARTRLNAGLNDNNDKPKPKSRFFPSGPATKAV